MQSLCKGLNISELIVKFIIKTTDEVGKDKWLISRRNVFGHVILEEAGLLDNFSSELTVLGKVSSINKSITIDTFRLVEPQFDEVFRLLD